MSNASPIELPATLPLLPLRHGVVLPGRATTIPVGRPRSRALAQELRRGDLVVLAVQRDAALDDPSIADLHPIATVARVNDSRLPNGLITSFLRVRGVVGSIVAKMASTDAIAPGRTALAIVETVS